MLNFRKFLAATALALTAPVLSAMPATAQTSAQSPEAQIVHATPPLWKVTRGSSTIYLLGTIHTLRPNVVWMEGPLKRAFDSSDTLMLEADMSDAAAVRPAMVAHGRSRDGSTLAQRLPAELYARYLQEMEQLHVPAAPLEKAQTWVVASMIGVFAQQRQGINPELGLEHGLIAAATAQDKPMRFFETIDSQFGLFEALSESQQQQLLEASLEGEDTAAMLDSMADVWIRGDAEALGEEVTGEFPEAMREPMIFARSRAWAQRIETMLDTPATVFIAVAAGHLTGEQNIRELLARDGIEVARVR